MASSFYKSPSFGHRDALNELARSQLQVSAMLPSLLRLWPAAGGRNERRFSRSDEPVGAAAAGSEGSVDGEHQKRRKRSHSRATSFTSCAPYDDGFQWRKYGEKKISKSKYTRSYYRCAYRNEQGCLATKQVQQKEMEDPPMFLVTCSNEHTCNCLSSLFLTEETEDERCSVSFQRSDRAEETSSDLFSGIEAALDHHFDILL